MDENPYQPPLAHGTRRAGAPRRFQWPTLIELLVVLFIVMILVAILLPAVKSQPHQRKPLNEKSPTAPNADCSNPSATEILGHVQKAV